jgi:phage/plasmid-like protein (TIGR03299 family)
MSRETIEWLNTYTLQSTRAWHTDAAIQAAMAMPTVYDGPIPVQDVKDRLFGWAPAEAPVTATVMDADGVTTITDTERKAIVRMPGALGPDDTGAILGVFKSGYRVHDYGAWLVDNVATILDDDLSIYSAGMLRGGAQAWVQVSVPDTIVTPEGVRFLPNLLAVTSLDGSLATTYKRTVTNTVCDNTMGMALREKGDTFKVKHSSRSLGALVKARDALALVHSIADDFAAEVSALCSVTVTDAQWSAFLDSLAPLKDDHGQDKSGRGLTMAQNKREEMNRLWFHDDRVTPWQGTAYGVVQAVNTHTHHVQSVRGMDRAQRNQTLAVTGEFDKLDSATAETILAIAGASI